MRHETELQAWLAGVAPPPLAELLSRVADACAQTARALDAGACAAVPDAAGDAGDGAARLQQAAGQRVAACLADCPEVAGWIGDPAQGVTVSDEHGSGGAYLVACEPLDGAAQLESNHLAASIFSVLPHLFRGTPASEAAFMQPGRRQVAAGYALYGPATVLALTTGRGVQLFALARGDADSPWKRLGENLRIAPQTTDFAINASLQRFWEKPVQRYVAECLAGSAGPRSRDFNMRWTACLAAETHRILTRGGVFLDPRECREPYRPGRLRLLVEAAPMAWLVEQAGGAATNGSSALLDLVPDALHQKVPVILGAREEVERITSYHADPSENVSWPLFKTRSLFVQPQA